MRIPLSRGRDFLESDSEDAPRVAIISQAMADRCWPGQDPLGRLFTTTSDPKHPLEIVGIVGNIRRDSLESAPSPFFYMPLAQADEASIITLQVRTTSRPETMAREVTGLIHALDPAMPTFDVEPMTAAFETLNGFLLFQFAAGLTACLGILALLLAVVGVYGVISYAAARRAHEIGIRMALGAQAADVLKMILRHGLAMVSAGVLFGFVAAAGLARIAGNFLMGVPPLDPLTYLAAALVLVAVALTACYIPARRAMKVDPVVALRQE
jgi:predicted permease